MFEAEVGRGCRQWERTRDRGGGEGKAAENRRERRYGRRREYRAGKGGVGRLAGRGGGVR